jgi:hypothetical protein
MAGEVDLNFDSSNLLTQFHDHGVDFGDYPGWMFRRSVIYFDRPPQQSNGSWSSSPNLDLSLLQQTVEFAGGQVVHDVEDTKVTHIIVGEDRSRLKELREIISRSVTCKNNVKKYVVDKGIGDQRFHESSRWIGSRRVGKRRLCWTKNVRTRFPLV